MEKLLSREEAAELLGVDVRTIDAFRKRGQLGWVQIGTKTVKIKMSELERFASAATFVANESQRLRRMANA